MDKVSFAFKPHMTVMPAVLVGANVGGKPNYMTVAWTGVACMDPPMISIAVNKMRHTEKGIIENGTFSVNIPSTKNVVEMDYCGITSGSRVDKDLIFETFYGKLGTAPLIGEFPVNIECELRHTLELGSHNLHVGGGRGRPHVQGLHHRWEARSQEDRPHHLLRLQLLPPGRGRGEGVLERQGLQEVACDGTAVVMTIDAPVQDYKARNGRM